MKNKSLVGVGVVAGLLVVFVFAQYNALVRADMAIGIQWAEVENQFQRRADLVPDLVKVAKKYAEYEKGVIDDVVKARAALVEAASPQGKAAANEALNGALSSLLAVVENYPNLKADQTYIRLMDEMAGTENRIAVARRSYNNSVGGYNIKIRTIPAAWFARVFGFEAKQYIEVSGDKKEKPNYDL